MNESRKLEMKALFINAFLFSLAPIILAGTSYSSSARVARYLPSGDDFPYALSIAYDGPTVYDTPMTVNVTLVPKTEVASKNASTYYFRWTDGEGPFDCPHRLTRVFSPSPLLSVYNVTYHTQWIRCPPLWADDGKRTIGVEIYDDPDFDPDWSTPVARIKTQVQLIEHPVILMAAREIKLEPPWFREDTYHLKGKIFAFSCTERDPWQVMRWANATRYWSITKYDVPRKNYGRIFMWQFNRTGTFDVKVDTTLYMKMPPYPSLEGRNRTMIKTGWNTTRLKIIEKVRDLTLLGLNNNTIPVGVTRVISVSVNGTFPLTLNWTISYVLKGPSPPSGIPATIRGSRTCIYRYAKTFDDNDDDLSSHNCVVPIAQNFSYGGAYKIHVTGENLLSSDSKTVCVWVYSTKRDVPFTGTILFPIVFVVFALGVLVFGYVHYDHIRAWGYRSVEVANFQLSYSHETDATRTRSWRDLAAAWADWVRSLADAPNVPRKSYPDGQASSRESVGMKEFVRSLAYDDPQPIDHEDVATGDEGPMKLRVDANPSYQSYTDLKRKEELGFFENDYHHHRGVAEVYEGEEDESEEEIIAEFAPETSYQNRCPPRV